MVNKLTDRHSYDNIEDFYKYVIKCPCCGTVLNFGKDDVYKDEEWCITHEYIDCPECNEKIKLDDELYYS